MSERRREWRLRTLKGGKVIYNRGLSVMGLHNSECRREGPVWSFGRALSASPTIRFANRA
jgi:hypothetical protein